MNLLPCKKIFRKNSFVLRNFHFDSFVAICMAIVVPALCLWSSNIPRTNDFCADELCDIGKLHIACNNTGVSDMQSDLFSNFYFDVYVFFSSSRVALFTEMSVERKTDSIYKRAQRYFIETSQ